VGGITRIHSESHDRTFGALTNAGSVVDGGRLKIHHINTPVRPMESIPTQIVLVFVKKNAMAMSQPLTTLNAYGTNLDQ